MKTFSMSQAGANIAFPFSVNAPFSVKAIQIDNVTCATIIIGTKAFTIAQGGDITIVPPYSARAVLVQDIGTIWISSNGSVTFSTDRLGITLYDSEVQPFVSAYALANGPMIIANQTLFQQGIALGEIATPVNPASSTVDLYAKVDGHAYLLPAGGIEHQLLDDSSPLTAGSVLAATLAPNVRPVCTAYSSVSQTVANGGTTQLALDSDLIDTDTIHDLVTNNGRLTCKTAGTYVVTADVGLTTANTTGRRRLYITHSVLGVIATQEWAVASATWPPALNATSPPIPMAVGEYVTMGFYHDMGAAVTVNAGLSMCALGMVRVA